MVTADHCPETDQVRRFLAGDLSPDDRGQFTDHVSRCPRCTQLVAGLDTSGCSTPDPTRQTPATLTLQPGSAPPPVPAHQSATDRDASSAGGASLGTLQPGDRLGKYVILDVLGRGGMGVVFKAQDTILERTVAIKILGPSLAENSTARKRFIREGRSAAAIKDRHVVTIYGVEGHEDSPYLVLEYVEGKSLEHILAERAPLSIEEVVTIGAQIAQGLAAAHQKGLIHRDIKPANILLENETGRVTITDFGLARAVDDATLSRRGEICGTPHYMAPEQVTGEPIDHRADLFSLGSVLYYMCTGEHPFPARDTMAVLHRVVTGEPRPIQECNPHVPAWLMEVIKVLHAKDPEQRFRSAVEVKEALEAHRARVPSASPSPDPANHPTHNHEQPARPSRAGVAVAVVLGLVFLLSFPVFYFLTTGEGQPGSQEHRHQQPSAEAHREPETPKVMPSTPVSPPPQHPQQRVAEIKREPDTPKVAPSTPVASSPPHPRSEQPPKEPKAIPAPVKPDPPKPPERVPVAPLRTVARRFQREQKAITARTDPPTLKGVVVIRMNDQAGLALFREEGLSIRDRRTSAVISLSQIRNYIPLGEYTWDPADSSACIKVSPRTFTVTTERSVVLTVTHTPPPETASIPRGGNPPPPEPPPPPFPPPFGPPPRPPRWP